MIPHEERQAVPAQEAEPGLFDYDDAVEQALTPLWREARWGLEWASLRLHPVYYGVGVPRGRREPVLLIPGFMSGDLMMLEMHRWLRRIGYRSSLSRITWNNDCPNLTGSKLIHRVRALADKTGRRVVLVGHSLGGMLAKSIVQEVPEDVELVITLGSPFRSLVKAHPAIIGIWDKLKLAQGGLIGRNLHASCGTGHCTLHVRTQYEHAAPGDRAAIRRVLEKGRRRRMDELHRQRPGAQHRSHLQSYRHGLRSARLPRGGRSSRRAPARRQRRPRARRQALRKPP